jgi:hypothetical protein
MREAPRFSVNGTPGHTQTAPARTSSDRARKGAPARAFAAMRACMKKSRKERSSKSPGRAYSGSGT